MVLVNGGKNKASFLLVRSMTYANVQHGFVCSRRGIPEFVTLLSSLLKFSTLTLPYLLFAQIYPNEIKEVFRKSPKGLIYVRFPFFYNFYRFPVIDGL
jgi:hypothetical protein